MSPLQELANILSKYKPVGLEVEGESWVLGNGDVEGFRSLFEPPFVPKEVK